MGEQLLASLSVGDFLGQTVDSIKTRPKDFCNHDVDDATRWLSKVSSKSIVDEYERIVANREKLPSTSSNDIHYGVASVMTAVFNITGTKSQYVKRFVVNIGLSVMKELFFRKCRDCSHLIVDCKKCHLKLGTSISDCAECGYVSSCNQTEVCKKCGKFGIVLYTINSGGELKLPKNINDMVYNAYKGVDKTAQSINALSNVVSTIENSNRST